MRTANFTVLIALSLSVAACGGSSNRGLESAHQPVVSRTNYVLDVGNANGSGLSQADAARLTGWFESLQLGYGDRVAVETPGGDGDDTTRAAVATIAGRYGLLVDEIAPLTTGTLAPGSARVVVSRTKAEVPGCPDWSLKSEFDFSSKTLSNYGCAVNSNLAAMVADPRDLVQGRTTRGATDASTGGKAIKTYREKPATGAGELKSSTVGGNQ
ncbi:MAG: CpaD family pilus assembly protein [Sphingomonadaceae bacterium]